MVVLGNLNLDGDRIALLAKGILCAGGEVILSGIRVMPWFVLWLARLGNVLVQRSTVLKDGLWKGWVAADGERRGRRVYVGYLILLYGFELVVGAHLTCILNIKISNWVYFESINVVNSLTFIYLPPSKGHPALQRPTSIKILSDLYISVGWKLLDQFVLVGHSYYRSLDLPTDSRRWVEELHELLLSLLVHSFQAKTTLVCWNLWFLFLAIQDVVPACH